MSDITEGTLLGGRVRYRQFAAGHRSGFEPVLLAAAVPACAGELVLDLGTGAGAALLCLAARVPGLRGIGVDIDPALTRLANENFKINDLDNFSAINGDAAQPPFGRIFDHALANPPWHNAAGTASPDAKRALAHQARHGLVPEWIAAMAAVLKPNGSLTIIISTALCTDAAQALHQANYRNVVWFPLWPRENQPAKQVILHARTKGESRLMPGLVLHKGTGLSLEAEAILRHGAAIGEDRDFKARNARPGAKPISAFPST